jgi:uncharacterized protein (TIGR03437 family)
MIGGIPASVNYGGSVPGLIAGVQEINVQVPNDVPPNLASPIALQVGTVSTPSSVTVAIR